MGSGPKLFGLARVHCSERSRVLGEGRGGSSGVVRGLEEGMKEVRG